MLEVWWCAISLSTTTWRWSWWTRSSNENKLIHCCACGTNSWWECMQDECYGLETSLIDCLCVLSRVVCLHWLAERDRVILISLSICLSGSYEPQGSVETLHLVWKDVKPQWLQFRISACFMSCMFRMCSSRFRVRHSFGFSPQPF